MSLQYALLEALLTPAPDDYTAQVQNVKSYDMESVIEKMLQKGSTITKTDTLAVLNSFFETVSEIVRQGENVHLDLFSTRLSLSGIFNGATDTYDPKRHSIRVNVNAGKLLKEVAKHIKPEKVDSSETLPHILEVTDSISGSVNDKITSGGVLTLVGSRLKIAGENTENGVYLIDEKGKKYKVSTLVENKPARLIAILPSLATGTYTLQITTQFTGGAYLKQSRTGIFDSPLTV